MSNMFIGEVRLFGGSYAPRNWAFCDGRLVNISENDDLFALIGTIYGGDGSNTFALPDLRGRVPINQGQGQGLSNYTMAETGGTTTVRLDAAHIPAHQHALNATTATGAVTVPDNTTLLATPVDSTSTPILYVVPGTSAVNPAPMANQSIGLIGNSQQHLNVMPSLGVNYIIALKGIFPSRN